MIRSGPVISERTYPPDCHGHLFPIERKRDNAASESGVVSVYDISGRRLHRIAQAFLHVNAHVVAVDPPTHRVYFPLQNVDGKPVMRVMEPQ